MATLTSMTRKAISILSKPCSSPSMDIWAGGGMGRLGTVAKGQAYRTEGPQTSFPAEGEDS